jgi:hypothetical protein
LQEVESMAAAKAAAANAMILKLITALLLNSN